MTWWAVLGLAACAEPMAMTEAQIDPTVTERELLELDGFGANPGNVRLFLHAPRQPKPGTGLVVVLHGCLQSAADSQRAGWNTLAEARGFYVLYVQSSATNGCFRWFEPAHATRGQGEVASVVSGVDWVLQRYAVD
ncbi:MAG TPA: PHB depolymerase family esterase, partial [Archangium sp.]